MSDTLMSEILCMSLLLLINGRIFFSGHKNSIFLVALSPICVLISICVILAHGFTISAQLIFLTAFLTLIFNIHGFSRFISHLYVDRYRPAFVVFSLIIFVFCILETTIFVYYRETPINAKDFSVCEKKEVFNKNTIFWTFTPDEKNTNAQEKPILLFSCDKRSNTYQYRPYLIRLAQKGYTVYALDFYGKKVPYFSSILDLPFIRQNALFYLSFRKKEVFESMNEKITENILKEYDLLKKLALEKEKLESIVFIGDCMQKNALETIKNTLQSNDDLNKTDDFCTVFNLCSIDSYKTKGFGCITQTKPLLAKVLGQKKDESTEYIEDMVLQTTIHIMRQGL